MSGGAPIPVPSGQPKGDVILSIDDLKEAGSAKLSDVTREFFNSGTTDQRTLNDNVASLRKYHLRSRVLVDVSKLTTTTTCLNRTVKFPLGIAPAGLQALAHKNGELATSRAAATFGISMAISSYATYGVEDIVSTGRLINPDTAYAIQLYTMSDRVLQERIVSRAEAAGVKAIFLTGDSPVLGVRYNEWRNDFRIPPEYSLPILERDAETIQKLSHDNTFNNFNDSSHNWTRDIAWLRERTKMEIWVKGILTAEDVELAAQHGCDGVIISNHGGRQLDGVPATIDALVECAPVAKKLGLRCHVDGGFRRGSDIFVALALGAEHVWVGRPAIWGLAYNGQQGVTKMLQIMYEDFRRTMAMCGCVSVADIGPSCLARMGVDGVLRRVDRDSSKVLASL